MNEIEIGRQLLAEAVSNLRKTSLIANFQNTVSNGDTKSFPSSNVICIDNKEDWRTIIELRKSIKLAQKQEQNRARLRQIKKEKKALHNLMEKYQCAS